MDKTEVIKILDKYANDYLTNREEQEAFDYAIECVKERKVGKWIPVTERLPEEEGDYLVTKVDDENVTIIGLAYFGNGFGRMFFNNSWASNKTITAWKPLPKPYEEGAEDGT